MANDTKTTLDGLNKQFKELQKVLRATGKDMRDSTAITSKFNEKTGTLEKTFDKVSDKLTSYKDSIKESTLGTIGLTGGISSLIMNAFDLMKTMSSLGDQLTALSTSTGSVNQAVTTLYTAWGNSLGSLNQLQEAMMTLNNTGLTLGKQFTELTSLSGDLAQMTGESASVWGEFTGKMAFNFKATTKEIREITSAVISSGVKGAQLSVVMESVQTAIENVGYTARDSKEMVKALSKTISSAVGVFNKLGISAQSSTQFINKMLNPEEFQNNAQLFARLGISADDFFASLESGQGQMNLMNKMMGNLPELANQLSSVQNPFQRFNLAKQLGLPMEMVSKLAGKTKSEIEELMKVQFKQAKDDEALKKKQEAAKANQERWNDMLEQLKMQALAPIMGLISKHLPSFVKLLSSLASIASAIFTMISPIADKIATLFFQIAEWLGPVVQQIVGLLTKGDVGGALGVVVNAIGQAFVTAIPKMVSMMKDALMGGLKLIRENPKTALLAGVGLLAKNLLKKRDGSSASNSLFVTMSGASGGMLSMLGNLKNLKNLPSALGSIAQAPGIMGKLGGLSGLMKGGLGGLGTFAPAAGSAGGAGALAGVGAAAGPVALVLAAVAGALMGLSNSAKYFGKVIEGVDALTSEEVDTLKTLENAQKHKIVLDKDELKTLADLKKRHDQTKTSLGQDIASTLAGALSLGILPVIDEFFGTNLTGELATILEPLGDMLESLWVQIKPVFEFFWEYVKSIGATLFEIVKVPLKQFIDGLIRLKIFITGMVGAIKNLFSGEGSLIDRILKIPSLFWDLITGTFSDLLGNLGEMFDGLGKYLQNSFGEWFGPFWTQLKIAFKSIITGIEAFIADSTIGKELLGYNDEDAARLKKESDSLMRLYSNSGSEAQVRSLIGSLTGTAAEDYKNELLEFYGRGNANSTAQLDAMRAANKKADDSNKALGGIGAGIEKTNELLEKKDKPATLTAQMLNPFAISQVRMF